MKLQSLMIGALSFLASTLIFYTVSYYVLLLDWLPNHLFIALIILSALMISFLITRKSMSEPSAKAK
ncbi:MULTISPECIES: hypothetical protein [Bacillus cereus group]|uniref:Group-specific protein n=1 Tax=Bacillus cereus TaxID=1396 RepID=A0A2B1DY53_BACCE|nr:hypothetical protein [Bacillus cereus]PDY81204.1 hypothetical protein CON06_19515 [Bacillus cereus]PFA15146.1 hypothetical protein CN382_08300 [Bacillus cereus]PFM42872.1 hypothetical protein COJ43_02695 [Bacillus cereus]PGL65231.1 hypothetical protein CN927_00505 [Bacillus cereus]PGQ11008.1 hypothetical protein COA08_04265 [Bacillus cereus]